MRRALIRGGGPWLLSAAILAPVHAADGLPRLDATRLAPAQFAFVADPYSQAPFDSQILLVRSAAGRLHAWFIPVRQGVRRLPEDAQWSPGRPCAEFFVDFGADVIGCRDPALAPSIAQRYRWRIDGTRRTDFVPDLLPIPGHEQDGRFVIR